MKKQIKIFLLTTVIGISSIANADSTDPLTKNQQKINTEQRIERMKKNLNISEAQAIEIRTILTNTKNQIQDRIAKMKLAPAADKAAIRNEIKSTTLSTHNEILHILTPEQRIKAESLREAKKEQMKEKRNKMRSHLKKMR